MLSFDATVDISRLLVSVSNLGLASGRELIDGSPLTDPVGL
jgi:hypothetical protein